MSVCLGEFFLKDMGGGKFLYILFSCDLLSTSRHLMTGVGSYFYIVWAIWLRHCLNGRQDDFVLNWPSMFFSLPEVVQLPELKSRPNGAKRALSATNGYTLPADRKSI